MSAEFYEDQAMMNLDDMRKLEGYNGEYEDWFENAPRTKNNGESSSTVINGMPKGFKDNIPF